MTPQDGIKAQDQYINDLTGALKKDLDQVFSQVLVRVAGQMQRKLDFAAGPTPTNRRELRKIATQIDKMSKAMGVPKILDEFTAGFEGTLPYFEQILQSMSAAMKTPLVAKATPKDLLVLEGIKDGSRQSVEAALEVMIAQAKRNMLVRVAALSFEDTVETLRKTFGKGTAEAEALAATGLTMYARTNADNNFKRIEAEFGGITLRYKYEGPADKLTRPFCDQLIDRTKKLGLTRAEIDKLDNGQLPNVFITAGGYNCRHQWVLDPRQPKARKPAAKKAAVRKAAVANTVPIGPEFTRLPEQPTLSGAHEKIVYVDREGNRWLFKPVTPDRKIIAFAEQAAYEIARKIDPSAVEVRTITLEGRFGSIQKMVPDLSATSIDPNRLSAQDIRTLQRQHVVDWLISNHDAHPGQFIRSKDGQIVAIDKGQAGKFLGTDKLSVDYHPNAAYGEKEPIYNTLGRMWRSKQIELDPKDAFATIKAVEGIPDSEIRSIWEPVAKLRFDSAAKQDFFLEDAVLRKRYIRRAFESFYGDLKAVRDGVPPGTMESRFEFEQTKDFAQQFIDKKSGGTTYLRGMKEEWANLIRNSKPEAFNAAVKYTGSSYASIKTELRRGMLDSAADSIKETVNNLDKAFTYESKKPVAVYRGVKAALSNNLIEDLGFMSTSIDPRVASSFSSGQTVLRIVIRQGQELIPINGDSLYGKENEIILPRGTKLRTVGSTIYRLRGAVVRVVECEIEQ